MAPGNSVTLGYEKFQELVTEKSNGRVQVQLFANCVLGSDRVVIESVQLGILQMASCSSPNMANFAAPFMALDLPYITDVSNQESFNQALDNGELGRYFDRLSQQIGLKPIMFSEYGYRHFVSSGREITDAKSLRRMTVRTTDSRVDVEVAKVLGMNPTPIAWGEVYTALQQGTIESEANTLSLLHDAKHDEVLRYAVKSYHNYSLHILMINREFFDGLPADLQSILVESGQEALAYQRVLAARLEADAEQEFLRRGIKIHTLSPAQRAEFRAQTRPVWDRFNDEIPADLLELMLQTQRPSRGTATTLPSGHSPAAQAAGR
jgi:tripartite ATP-independent transporter DctP family solute receptor